jgi:thiamine-monophosphate kinase
LSEFDLIATYFSGLGSERQDVVLGVGDDCALLRVPEGRELAVSIDTLVAGVHFLAGCDPHALGHKSLAVGLSDLAAMGADPAWATLALTLPRADEGWLRSFANGFSSLAMAHGMTLVGGDITRGPLSVSVQVHGLVPAGEGLLRCGARPGDLVCVSGTLGDAGLALRRRAQVGEVYGRLRDRLDRPTPRVALGRALRGLATAMIDLSDGLGADLGHILAASGVGAAIRLADLPLGPEVAEHVAGSADWSMPVASGDDYELCFTLPVEAAERIETLSAGSECAVHVIGQVTRGSGITFLEPDGSIWVPDRAGYNHFAHQA